MITFFRKIRQKMIKENKVSKYLLYAIGEIALVMIGILLALQVNNWKESRNTKELENQIMNEIQSGLISDLKDIKINFDWHKSIHDNQNALINWIEQDGKMSDSIVIEFSKAHKLSSFLVSDAPFQSLKAFGLNKISNDSIKSHVIVIYDLWYPEYRLQHSTYLRGLEYVLQTKWMYFDNWTYVPGELMQIKEPSVIKSDLEYLTQLKFLKQINKGLIYTNTKMINNIEITLELIEKHKKNTL